MRVHHLNCGTMHPVVLGRDPMVCHCLLVETDKDGLVLVDAGFAVRDLAQPKLRLGKAFTSLARIEQDIRQAALSQVEALGFGASDVRHIILTHMDLDHVSGLVDFPAARVHVHATEHALAIARTTLMHRRRYLPALWAHDPSFRTYSDLGEPWFGFDAVRALDGVPPEILLIPLAGHTRGHAGVAVKAGDRWLLHAGDAYFSRGEVHAKERECPLLLRTFQTLVEMDRKARLANQARLRQLANTSDEVQIFSAHDPRELTPGPAAETVSDGEGAKS